jgi:hypothetical protein
MRRASPIGRGAEERGGEGCIRCRNVSDDFFIHPSHLLRRSSPKGRASRREKELAEPYFCKLPYNTRAKPNCPTAGGEAELRPAKLGGGSKPPPYGQRRRFRKSHVEKRNLTNRISSSSRMIQWRSLIAPPQVAKPNYVQRSWGREQVSALRSMSPFP